MTKVMSISLNESNISGNISSLKSLVLLQTLNISNTVCTGYFKSLCNEMKNQGRITGQLSSSAYGSSIKVDEDTVFPNNAVVATFTSSGISYSGV